ncbi:MAG: TonB-dependent receptor [Porticoccaceae bacterium]
MKTARKNYPIFVGVLSTMLAAVCVGQDDTVGNDDFDIFSDDIPSVYSASKYEQKVTEAPASVSIVTAEEIKRYGYRNFGDILRAQRGFYVTNDRNYSYVGVRGFGQPGDYNTRILLLIDGVRANENVYDSFGADSDFLVDIDLIDRVEIVRGPGSSLYGTSAFFAVINVTTKNGRDYDGAELAVDFGDQGTSSQRATWGKHLASGLDVLMSVSNYKSRGDDNLYYQEFDDPLSNNGHYKNNDDEDAANVLVKLAYQGLSFNLVYQDRTKEIPTSSYGTVFNSPVSETTDEILEVNLGYTTYLDSGAEWATTLGYGAYEYWGDYMYDYSDDGDLSYLVVNKDKTESEWWTLSSQLSGLIGDSQRVIAGIDVRDNVKQDQSNFDEDVYLDDKRSSEVYGLYIQDEIEITDKVTLNLGVRYDKYDTFGDNFSPRVAVIYNPQPQTAIKLLYGEAFRAPNAYELYYHDGGFTTKPAVGLEPETIESVELAVEHYMGRTLLSASVYYNEITDLIAYRLDPVDDLLFFGNLDQIATCGFELGLESHLENGLRYALNYAYQDNEDDTTGKILNNSPRNMLKANFLMPLFQERIVGGLELQYMGARNSVQGPEADAHVLTNLTISGDTQIPGLSLSGSIHNLLDEEYDDPGSAEHTQALLEQDGRTFLVRASYQF